MTTKPIKPTTKIEAPEERRNFGGRPPLGESGVAFVQRSVKLDPTYWNWLDNQPDGALKTIRRLILDAMTKDARRK